MVTAIEAGSAIASWWEAKQTSRPPAPLPDKKGKKKELPYDPTDDIDQLFRVLAILGQRLFALDAVNTTALPQSMILVRQSLVMTNLALSKEYGTLGEVMQLTIAGAMEFCAACYPMHIYRGFGCGVLDDIAWGNPVLLNETNPKLIKATNFHILRDMDRALAYLKSLPHEIPALRKSPGKLSSTIPQYAKLYEKSDRKKLQKTLEEIAKVFEKNGYPQPKYGNIEITTWSVPFATWGSTFMYEDQAHSYENIVRWQIDPGRILYSWVVGDKLNLRAGQALEVGTQEHLGALAEWLEGHHGIYIRVLLDTELDQGKTKYSRSTRKVLKEMTGSEIGITGEPTVVVRDPTVPLAKPCVDFTSTPLSRTTSGIPSPPMSQSNPSVDSPVSSTGGVREYFNKPNYSTSTIGVSELPAAESSVTPAPTSQRRTSDIKRRPVATLPLPPPYVDECLATALHGFDAGSETQLSFRAGDVLVISDQSGDDGWWKARADGQEFFVPASYLKLNGPRAEEPRDVKARPT